MRHIRRIRGLALLLAVTLTLSACQKATRYGPVPKPPSKEDDTKPEPLRPSDLWVEPKPVLDVPILFVPPTSKEWERLPSFWNEPPPKFAGVRTSHIGHDPLGAVLGLVLAWQAEVVKIKVPRGLPDPTPNIPAGNRPTLGKWELGKQLFFDKILQTPSEKLSCASCHVPPRFCNDFPAAPQSTKNTPSLINSVFNRTQFWDGRATSLEETVLRDPAKAMTSGTGPKDEAPPHHRHNWIGTVDLRTSNEARQKYQKPFERVFGIPHPTHDAIAKALATYVRTLLSGDSILDHARGRAGDSSVLTAAHFEPFLDEAATRSLDATKGSRADLATELALGNELFHGKAGCVNCHAGPLFTDYDFHDIGLGGLMDLFPGQETGRFAVVPVGLKETRLISASRTPTLRGVSRTAPYMRDGRFTALADVVNYFNKIPSTNVNPPLAAPLLASPGRARDLNLTPAETQALVRFLRAMDGQPLDKKLIE